MEQWKAIKNFPSYQVSSEGRVRNRDGKILKHYLTWQGRPIIYLSIDGVRTKLRLHTLVLETFSGERPSGQVARHLNGIKTDNRAENLKWGTSKQNSLDRLAHGTYPNGETASRAKLTWEQVKEIRESFIKLPHKRSNGMELAKKFNIHYSSIWRVVSRTDWKEAA